MKPSTHRYVLPPVLVGIHILLLLPIIVSRPDLRVWTGSSNGNDEDDSSTRLGKSSGSSTLYLRHAVIFGLVGFVVAYLLKQIVGRIPLPSAQRRRKLAACMERAMLFGMGALEEIWRYGVVQIVVWNVGLGGGPLAVGLGNRAGWETVYLMGWVWSIFECMVSWNDCRPDSKPASNQTSTHNTPTRPRIRPRRTLSGVSAHGQHIGGDASPPQRRRESLGALRRGSVLAVQGDENPFLNGLPGRAWQDTSDANRSAVSLLSGGLDKRGGVGGDEESGMSEWNGGDGRLAATRGFIFPSAAPASPVSRPFSTILESRMSPKQSYARPPAGNESESEIGNSALEESDFGDDEQDDAHSFLSDGPFSFTSSRRTSSETSRDRDNDGVGTPLLSSSIPYDPSHHPHHESSSLLRNQHRRMSYNTLGNNLPVVHSDDGDDDGHIVVRDYDVENQPLRSHPVHGGNQGEDDDDDVFRAAARERREYPSYPSYSAGYNHSHFSLHNNSAGTEGSPPSHATKPTSALNQQARSQLSPRTRQRLLYGVSVNSMSPWLPIIWRTSALLRHLASVLAFAYFPLGGQESSRPLWPGFLVVGIVALLKGWYTVIWLGGNVARSGAKTVTTVTAVISIVLYFGSLWLWGII